MRFIILFLFMLRGSTGVIYNLNEDDYALMPPVFHLDPYDSCLHQPGGLYCAVEFALVSDTASPLLDMIHNYSAHTAAHFNHTKLLHGICFTRTCEKFVNQTIVDQKASLEACLNETMWNDYQLKTNVAEFSCHTDKESMVIDVVDIVVAVICLAIVLLNVVGSLYDAYATTGKDGDGIRFFLCFSVRRNWRKLTAKPSDHPDPRVERFKGLNFVRALAMTCVVLAHTSFPVINIIENTSFIEQDLLKQLSMQLFASGSLLIQLFLIMSGLLLAYKLQKMTETSNLNWTTLPKGILQRWLRLTPPYAIVLALSATWLRHIGDGPYKMKYSIKEASECRRNWWYHLLYINNYYSVSDCMVHSWYLATDTQLYILGIIIWLLCRNLRIRIVVLPLLYLVGILIPALHIYFQDLDGAILSSPENLRTFYIQDTTFNKVFVLGHTNISGYVLGLSAGYLIYHWQMTGLDVKKYKRFRFLYWAALPIGLGVTFFGIIFYADGPRTSILTRIAYAVISKSVYTFGATCIIVGMVLKFENTFRALMEWEGWTSLGRVSYSTYLIHMAIMRYIGGKQKYMMNVSLAMGQMTIAHPFIAYLAAYPFWMVVESPLNQLVSLCLSPRKPIDVVMDCEKNKKEDHE